MKVLLKRTWWAGKGFGRFRKSESKRDYREVPDGLRDNLPRDATIVEDVVKHEKANPAPKKVEDDSLTDMDMLRVQGDALAKVEREAEKARKRVRKDK